MECSACAYSILGNDPGRGLVIVGYIVMGINPQANIEVFGTLLLNEGREYIEIPRWGDILVVISVLLFLLNCFMTVMKTKKFTSVQGTLLGGLTLVALFYLPGMFYTSSMVKDQYWWWWVVHLWVEGSWEIVAAALLAFMLHKLLGADVKVLAKWMYIEVGLGNVYGHIRIGTSLLLDRHTELLALGRWYIQLP